MENLQTLNDFPTIDVWVNTDGSPLIKTNHKYEFQGNILNLNDNYAFNGLFVYHFDNYTKSINIKRVGQDTINTNNINLVVAVCPHFNNVVDVLKNITLGVYNWCKDNNIKIAVFLTREPIFPADVETLNVAIHQYLINHNFNSSVVKIIYNAYNYIDNMIYTDYLVPIDTMRRTLRFILANTSLNLSNNRSHNFSLLTGALYNRRHRVLFLSKCYNLNLLKDNFFYSICMLNRDRDLDYIKQVSVDFKYGGLAVKNREKLFQHKTYDKNGELMLGANMYDTMDEYFIPPQVLDSYIHIVLETTPFAPSLTEKIFKPIAAGLPFVWHGCQNILPYLESLGFKKYSYIDYSFDSDPDPDQRLNLLIKEVQRLNKVDLQMLVHTNKKTAEHNQQVFESISKDYNDLWKHLK